MVWSTAARSPATSSATPAEREWLEGLLWPLVGERVWAFKVQQEAADPAPKAAVVETPLLFEAGMDGIYDATIAVIADEDVRRARAAARGHEAVDERAARQLSQDEKAQRATFVVRNDGTEADLEATLSSVLDKLSNRREQPARQPQHAAARPPRASRRRRRRAPRPAAPPSPDRARRRGGVRSPPCWRCSRCFTMRCARSRCRCATRTSSASRRATRAWTRR